MHYNVKGALLKFLIGYCEATRLSGNSLGEGYEMGEHFENNLLAET